VGFFVGVDYFAVVVPCCNRKFVLQLRHFHLLFVLYYFRVLKKNYLYLFLRLDMFLDLFVDSVAWVCGQGFA
jgi:hypothetical protein